MSPLLTDGGLLHVTLGPALGPAQWRGRVVVEVRHPGSLLGAQLGLGLGVRAQPPHPLHSDEAGAVQAGGGAGGARVGGGEAQHAPVAGGQQLGGVLLAGGGGGLGRGVAGAVELAAPRPRPGRLQLDAAEAEAGAEAAAGEDGVCKQRVSGRRRQGVEGRSVG